MGKCIFVNIYLEERGNCRLTMENNNFIHYFYIFISCFLKTFYKFLLKEKGLTTLFLIKNGKKK